MPSYFFHLVFELYPYPQEHTARSGDYQGKSYLPPPGTDIFWAFSALNKHHLKEKLEAHNCIPGSLGVFKGGLSVLKDEDTQTTTIPIRDAVHAVKDEITGSSSAGDIHEKTLDEDRTDLQIRRSASRPQDWRYDRVSISNIDMTPVKTPADIQSRGKPLSNINDGIGVGSGGLATKGRYLPSKPHDTDVGWGIVHLYRDAEETPGLYDDEAAKRSLKAAGGSSRGSKGADRVTSKEEECTTLCILAVPSYLTPSDFLGFVGEKTREDVTHFRMIRSEKANRYMVLMKFKSGRKAKEWRKEWNGKVFNSMEPENCHVVFIKSVEFQTPGHVSGTSSFPDMTNDPFTPSTSKTCISVPVSAGTSATVQSTPLSSSLTTKPLAPPTPSLIELPTCPVCLERMDETTGLLTILCQHVFHCACLQKWKGSGCPVCRYTQDDLGRRNHASGEEVVENGCSVCRSDANLWICLICGNIGCGRYDAAHAYAHYEQTFHCYAMDTSTQRVWDYAGDGYVHRLIQNKSDGKFVDLPASLDGSANVASTDGAEDYVPREKLENISMEYTHLLTSQLDSQRLYFEEKLERAADKASEAIATADKAADSALQATQQLAHLQDVYNKLSRDIIPSLERDKARAERKAEKFEAMARKMEKDWREEKAMNGSLMERIEFMSNELKQLKEANLDLSEQNRDLSFFISSQEKLKDHTEDIREGTISIPDPPVPKKKGKGKK
ncbi:MAG: hypothetical protein M1830_006227 [Pleopsidium flavum]|nr:MAG: hypothetical protein M1830_006227 [Pleopsidium flavum]